MKKFFFSSLFIMMALVMQAQYFQTGQDPASIKWRQINTENFQLIYPDYFEQQAQKLAFILEKVYNYAGYSLNYQPKKISIILHTQTVKSNGLVAWAPKRSEFYTTPHQAIYSQDWLEQLALHEFRHVVQVDKINSEIPKIIKLLLAQQGTALVVGAYLPWWFLEGDAVVTETALSKSGRGRFPSFLVEHKALAVEKDNYSYDKAINGSYKNYVPNHYKLGYYLVGETRARFGSGIWDSVLTDVGKKPFSLNPFNKSLKKNIGFSKATLYSSVFDSLKQSWLHENQQYKPIDFIQINKPQKTYTNYKHNHWLNDTTLISYKTNLNRLPAFVKISESGNEELIFKPGDIFNESVNYRDNLIVWSEHIPNPRWAHSGSSLIRIYNIDAKSIIELKLQLMGFSPAISPDKKLLACVEGDFSYQFYLSVYNIETQKLVQRIQLKNNNYLITPQWISNSEMVLIVLDNNQKKLAKINVNNKQLEWLTSQNLGEIQHLNINGNQILFISSYSGKNGLYRLNLKTKKIELLFEPRFNIAYPAINPSTQKIAISNYTADGYKLIELPQNLSPSEIKNINPGTYKLADKLATQESGIPGLTPPDSSKYNSRKYSKIAHLIHFHSWAPVYFNVNSYDFTPGVSILSQNKLGTTETVLGYRYDVAGKTGKVHANFVYKGWYPVFDFDVSTGNSASEYTLIENTTNQQQQIVKSDTTLKRFTWKETNTRVGIKLPLNFSKGIYNKVIQPEVRYEYTNYAKNNSTPEGFFEGNYQSLTYRFYLQQVKKKSYQDLISDFGYVFDLDYRHSPFGKTSLGNMITAQSLIFLPGFMPNHGFKIYAGVQNKNTNENYGFTDIIRYPRGWGRINTNKMYSFAADYKMPLLYPDINVGPLFYLKRINLSLFADYARLNGNIIHNQKKTGTFNKSINSFGCELTSDIHIFRFYAPIEIGARTSYIPEYKSLYFDLLFSIDFTSL